MASAWIQHEYMNELREFVKNHPSLPQDYINNCFVGKLKFPDESEEIVIREEDFEIIRELGEGSFGKVIKIKHKPTNKIMAHKVQGLEFQPEDIDKKSRNKYYLYLVRETIVLKESKSPYIPGFYGMHFLENYIVYYMEALDFDARKLYKVYSQNRGDKTMFDGEALSIIAASVTNALAYLKENLEVMHRDVKPANILLDFKGNVKLCDLGMVVFLERSIAKSFGRGSPAYWAPEIFEKGSQNWLLEFLGRFWNFWDNLGDIKRVTRTEREYNVKSDVWSLGISLIEIARFKNPYEGISQFDLKDEILNKDAPQLNDGEGGYSGMLITFISQCLVKDETKRPHIRDLKKTDLVNNFSDLNKTRPYMSKFLSQLKDKLEEK